MRRICIALTMFAMACASSHPTTTRSTPIDCLNPDAVSFYEQNSGQWRQVWKGVQLYRAGEIANLNGHDLATVRVTEAVSRALCDTECRTARDVDHWNVSEVLASEPIAISYGSIEDALADSRFKEPITLTPVVELEFSPAGAIRYEAVRSTHRPLGASLAVHLGPGVGAVLHQQQPGPRVWLSTGAAPGDFDALVEAIRESTCGASRR